MQPDPPDLDELVSRDDEIAAGSESSPVVVVDHRRSGLPWALVPVLMALCIAAGVIASRPGRPVQPWLVAQRIEGPIVKAPRDDSAPREPLPDAEPEAKVETPTTEPAPDAFPEVPPPPIEPPAPQKRTVLRPAGIGFDPDEGKKPPEAPGPKTPKPESPKPTAPPAPALKPAEAAPKPEAAAFAPLPPPIQATEPVEEAPQPVKTEDVQADILREAEAKRLERKQLEAAKPELLQPDPAVIRAQQQADEAQAKAEARADRGQFHQELAKILREAGSDSASAIQALCATSPRTVPESAKKRVAKFLMGPGAGIRRPTRIKLLRSNGYSEALILSDIAEQEMKQMGSRSGPTRLEDVWVLAARILMSYPPTPLPAATGRAGQGLPQ